MKIIWESGLERNYNVGALLVGLRHRAQRPVAHRGGRPNRAPVPRTASRSSWLSAAAVSNRRDYDRLFTASNL